MYTLAEASRLSEVSQGTIRNWLFGYEVEGTTKAPLFETSTKPDAREPIVSFLRLIEIVIAGRLRKAKGVPYRTVYKAYRNAKQEFSLEYPFAHLRLEAIGGHIVHMLSADRLTSSHQSLDMLEQWTLPGIVQDTIAQIDYADEDLAARWFPLGRDMPVVIDPLYSSGAPTIAGRGVTVHAIHSRFKAGLFIDVIAQDLVLEPVVVERALQYAHQAAI